MNLAVLSISLTATMSALKVFGNERVNYWREKSAGVSGLAYFLGKDFAFIPSMVAMPIIFNTIFYPLMSPRTKIIPFYSILFLVQYTASGLGMAISTIFHKSVSQLAAVVVVLISSMVAGLNPVQKKMEKIAFFSFFNFISFQRYGFTALYLTELKRYKDIYNLDTTLDKYGFKLDQIPSNLIMLFAFGIVHRVIAYAALVLKDRDKQK